MSRVITDTITTSATDNTGTVVSAPIRFLYDSADPFCVTLDCTALNAAAHGSASSEPILWSFARSLLTDAIVADGWFGVGDVIVERFGPFLTITLASPDGEAHLRFGHHALMRFVQRTAALVPLGRESEHLDVDGAIAQLLRGVR